MRARRAFRRFGPDGQQSLYHVFPDLGAPVIAHKPSLTRSMRSDKKSTIAFIFYKNLGSDYAFLSEQ